MKNASPTSKKRGSNEPLDSPNPKKVKAEEKKPSKPRQKKHEGKTLRAVRRTLSQCLNPALSQTEKTAFQTKALETARLVSKFARNTTLWMNLLLIKHCENPTLYPLHPKRSGFWQQLASDCGKLERGLKCKEGPPGKTGENGAVLNRLKHEMIEAKWQTPHDYSALKGIVTLMDPLYTLMATNITLSLWTPFRRRQYRVLKIQLAKHGLHQLSYEVAKRINRTTHLEVKSTVQKKPKKKKTPSGDNKDKQEGLNEDQKAVISEIVRAHQSVLQNGKAKITYSWLKTHPLHTLRYYHFLLQILEGYQEELRSNVTENKNVADNNCRLNGKLFSMLPVAKYKTASLQFQPRGFYTFVRKLGFRPKAVDGSLPENVREQMRQKQAWSYYLKWDGIKSKKWKFAEHLHTDGIKASLLFETEMEKQCTEEQIVNTRSVTSNKRKSVSAKVKPKEKINLASPAVTKGLFIDRNVRFDFKNTSLQQGDVILKVIDPGRNPDILTWLTCSLSACEGGEVNHFSKKQYYHLQGYKKWRSRREDAKVKFIQ